MPGNNQPLQGLPMSARPGTGPYATDAQGPFGPTQGTYNDSDPNQYYRQNNSWMGNPYAMMYANWYNSQYGDEQQQFSRSVADQQRDLTQQYRGYGRNADMSYGYNPATGGFGFLPASMRYGQDEQDAITREQERYGYNTTPDEFSQMSWNGDERNAFGGDPYAAYNTFASNIGNAYTDMDFQEQRTFDALGEQDRNLRGIGEGYANQTGRILDSAGTGMRGAAYSTDMMLDPAYGGRQQQTLNSGESAARDIYRDPNLKVSSDFMTNYKFGPNDTLDLEALAGTAAGARYRNMISDIERQAAAQGQTSPMALASMRERFERQAAQEAADAAIGARSQGRQMELATTRGREDTRLGAEQTQAGMGLGAELRLGDRRVGAESETEQMRLGAAAKARALQVGAESDLARMGLSSASDLAALQSGNERAAAASRLGSYANLGNQRQGLNQFATSGLTDTQRYGEATGSQRTGALADERAGAARANANTRYSQGMTTSGVVSEAQQRVADQRLAAERERRGYLTGMTGGSMQGMLTSTGQAGQAIQARQSAGNTAAGQYSGYDAARRNVEANAKNPSGADQVIGAVVGALGGYRP